MSGVAAPPAIGCCTRFRDRCRPRLAIEAFAPVRIARQLAGQDLERDPALQPGVVGEVDLSHPTFANELNDPVVPEGGPNHAARDSRS